jgi:phosphoheptose isomerase
LVKRYRLPVFIEHDGNAGALAEYYFGAARGTRNALFLTAGTGLGGGMILNGELYRGTTDTAGEVGHIRLADTGPVEYGKAGSWEAFCSGVGMVKLAHNMHPGRWPADLTTRQLVDMALAGDAHARQVIRKSGEWLGRGLAILIDTLNPEVIVLGSLGGALGDLLLQPARDVVNAECIAPSAEACRIVSAELGARIGDVAALMAAINHQRIHHGDDHTVSKDQINLDKGILSNMKQANFSVALADSLAVQESLKQLANAIESTAQVITTALQNGRKVLVFGNGGSAAQAQHLAGELVGKYGPVRKSLPAIALTADSGVVTCIANDFGYDDVFARQVDAFAQPGDIVIGFTTSGKSSNVLKALESGQRHGAITIALTGANGLTGNKVDYCLAIQSSYTARIQEAHGFIVHYWCDVIDEAFSLTVGAESGLEER